MRNSSKSLFLIFACLSSSWVAADSGDQLQQVLYQCERGVSLPVTYLNTASGGAYAVLQVDGQQIPMSIAVSASGARYESIDQGRNYSWHTKSDSGVLSWRLAGDASENVVVLKECVTGTQMLADATQ